MVFSMWALSSLNSLLLVSSDSKVPFLTTSSNMVTITDCNSSLSTCSFSKFSTTAFECREAVQTNKCYILIYISPVSLKPLHILILPCEAAVRPWIFSRKPEEILGLPLVPLPPSWIMLSICSSICRWFSNISPSWFLWICRAESHCQLQLLNRLNL